MFMSYLRITDWPRGAREQDDPLVVHLIYRYIFSIDALDHHSSSQSFGLNKKPPPTQNSMLVTDTRNAKTLQFPSPMHKTPIPCKLKYVVIMNKKQKYEHDNSH